MMTAFIQNGRDDAALDLYENIHRINPSLKHNAFSHLWAIKACGAMNDVDRGEAIHHLLVDENPDILLKTTLIGFYGDHGNVHKALDVFHSVDIEMRDIPLHNAMMTSLINNHQHHEALDLYDSMRSIGSGPGSGSGSNRNGVNMTSHLLGIKAATNSGHYERGVQIHREIDWLLSDDHILIKNAFIDFYGQFCELEAAQKVFDSIDAMNKDIVTINSMLKALVINNRCAEALDLYDRMERDFNGEIERDEISHIMAIKSCINIKEFERGQQIHSMLPTDVIAQSAGYKSVLIDLYGNSHQIDVALDLFHCHFQQNTVVTNAMMSAHIENGQYPDALRLFDAMPMENRNDSSFVLAIKCCLRIPDLERGKAIVSDLGMDGHQKQRDNQLMNILIKFHGECGDMESAERIYNEMVALQKRDEFTVGAMMTALIRNERYSDALGIYDDATDSRNDIVHLLGITACSKMNDFERGHSIHNEIAHRFNEWDISLKNGFIDFYGRCGDINASKRTFEAIPSPKCDSIGALMDAFCRNGQSTECIELFMKSMNNGIDLDVICYVVAFKAFTNNTALYLGQEIHEQLKRDKNGRGWMLRDVSLQISLINFYGKCSMLSICEEIIGEIENNEPQKYRTEIGIWNAMIHAFGRNGDLERVHAIYERICDELECEPDRKTFILMLNACGHCGDVERAQVIWNEEIESEEMKRDCFVVNAFIDCCARNGLIEETYKFVLDHDDVVDGIGWMSLLTAAKIHSHPDLVQQIHSEMNARNFNCTELLRDNLMTSASVTLSNQYATD